MKKRQLLIAIVAVVGIIALFASSSLPARKSLHRHWERHNEIDDVLLTIYKKADYAGPAYANSLAQLHVTVKTDENVIVSDTTFNSEYLTHILL